VEPGEHCVTCPLRSECDFGVSEEDKW